MAADDIIITQGQHRFERGRPAVNKLPTRMTFFYQLHPVVSAVYFFEAILSLLLFNHLATALTGYVGLLLVGIFYTGQSAVWRQFKWNLSLLLMIVFF
ncbi:hypothetical protein [Lentilactobacillus buchneri]|uniref:hypothetical protein n=1 Tax=Lentilactobacillus buchneri TaxID=1581 RepID=UPI0021A9B18D|nr:hypothetical protein [Lentilactobacillus buchneri]